MQTIELPIKIVREHASIELPQYMSCGASGLDLPVCIDEDIVLGPLERALIPTGIAVEIPKGFEAQIRPRSGLAIKHGITLLNAPGTIDSDYRGEIQLIVINLSNESFVITHGMRMAQMIIAEYVSVKPKIVEDLNETMRGTGGFGHTGH